MEVSVQDISSSTRSLHHSHSRFKFRYPRYHGLLNFFEGLKAKNVILQSSLVGKTMLFIVIILLLTLYILIGGAIFLAVNPTYLAQKPSNLSGNGTYCYTLEEKQYDFIDAIYFATVTVSTLGYGDS